MGRTVPIRVGNICGIELPADVHFLGAQRFILKRVADAEQILFGASDSQGQVARLYWLQVESLLEGQPGEYDYHADSLLNHGVPFHLNLRNITAAYDPASDRAAVYSLLRAQHYSLAPVGPRLRLVHPASDGRSEFLIIYMESAAYQPYTGTGDMVDRALRSLTVVACR